MKKLLLPMIAFAAMVATVTAGEYKFPKNKPLATITTPSGWKVEEEDDSLDVTSKDDEIYINIEPTDTESVEGAIQESMGYLKKNKVKLDTASMKKTEGKLNGMDVVDLSFDGTDADGACKVSITILAVTKDKGLIVLYWASPEGEKKHRKEIDELVHGVKPIKKGED